MSAFEAFGKGMIAYYQGDRSSFRIHRDDGYVDEHTFDQYFSEHDDWPEHEKKALKHVEGRVLDIGCGAGRHSLWLQERGIDVVAIDVSGLAVEVTKSRGIENSMVMSAVDLYFRPGSFDTVLLMGNNFGIAGNVQATEKMLRELYQITTRKGRIVATCHDPHMTDNPAHLRYHELNRKSGRRIGQVTLRIEYKGEFGDWFDLLMLGLREMKEITSAAGWKATKLYKEADDYAAVLSKLSR